MPNQQKIQSAIKDSGLETGSARNAPKEVGQYHLIQLFKLIDGHFNDIRPSEIQGYTGVLMHKVMMPSEKYSEKHMAQVFFTMHETNQFITALHEQWILAKAYNREVRKEVSNG